MKKIAVLSLLILSGYSHASNVVSTQTEGFEIIDISSASAKVYPTTFRTEDVVAFKNGNTSPQAFGQLEMDEENHKKFLASQPYRFQVITGSDEKVATRIKLVEDTVKPMDCYTWAATYQFTSPYAVRFNAQFEVQYKRVINLNDSVLGARDFIKGENQPLSSASFFYIRTMDEDFIRETNEPRRLNGNLQKYLLMKAQVIDGENIFEMDTDTRKVRAQELFEKLLEENNLALNQEGVLPIDEYVNHILAVRDQLLAHHQLTVNQLPDIQQVDMVALHEGKALWTVPRQ